MMEALPKMEGGGANAGRSAGLKLKRADRRVLGDWMRGGGERVRGVKRVRILQLSDRGKSAGAIAEAVGVNGRTVERVRQRYRIGGLERILHEALRGKPEPALKEPQKQKGVAMLCGPSPSGRSR